MSCSASTRSRSRTREQFHQRPKLDNYGDYIFLVFYGAWRRARPTSPAPLREVHMFVSGQYLITHSPRSAAGARSTSARSSRDALLHSEQFLLYRVLDALTDSFFPVLVRYGRARSTTSRPRSSPNPTDEQLQRLFALKRQLVAMRKVVTPQRDLFARSIDQIAELPGLAARRARLLPRRLRPPDPDQRPDRLLPRPALRRDRPLPLDGQQPPERRDEAAHGDRHDLPAAVASSPASSARTSAIWSTT